jgi:hypothetical protein
MTEVCRECGQIILPVVPLCACGHSYTSHNDNGGKARLAYCTVGSPSTEDKPYEQCPCAIPTSELREKEQGWWDGITHIRDIEDLKGGS